MMPKVALITGASSGLGLEMAKQLAAEGYAVILLARGQERLTAAVEQIRDFGGTAVGFSCDVTDEAKLIAVRDEVKAVYSSLDYLIINAGAVNCKLVKDFREASDLKRDLEVNLWGTVLTAYLFMSMLATGSHILMISSGYGLAGPAGYGTYAAAKAGIIAFSGVLRQELKGSQISVHVACPGDIDTPQYRQEQADMPAWMKANPAAKTLMAPGEAAAKILRKCRQGRYLIIISRDVSALNMLIKMPTAIKNYIFDKIFPWPGAK